jgi:AraC-type DNA-binding domain-containing proteins
MNLVKAHDINNTAIYEKINTYENSPLKIIKIATDKEKVPKHWHRSVEIIVPKMEKNLIWVNGKTKIIAPNQLFVINSAAIHSCKRANPQATYIGYAIQIKYDFLLESFPNIENTFFDNQISASAQQELLSIIDCIIDIWENKQVYYDLKLMGYTYLLVHNLLKYLGKPKTDAQIIQSKRNKERLIPILSYLDEHYTCALSSREIADFFHISYGHLAKLFKTHLNLTIKEYITILRIKKSCELLTQTDYSITTIATTVGFPNIKSFNREFKKTYEKTPKRYREQFLKETLG